MEPSKGNFPKAFEKAVEFHGHACPGLAIGVRMAHAALAALVRKNAALDDLCDCRLVSPDEELVCVTETDACCVDAIQSLLGTSLGKGNLLLKPRGKTAASFYYRPGRKALRILWTEDFQGMKDLTRPEKIEYILTAPREKLLQVRPITFEPPCRAVVAPSLVCASCGEKTAEYAVRLKNGQPYCQDCWETPSRIL